MQRMEGRVRMGETGGRRGGGGIEKRERERVHWSELGHQGRVRKEDESGKERGKEKRWSFSQRQSRHCAAVCREDWRSLLCVCVCVYGGGFCVCMHACV